MAVTNAPQVEPRAYFLSPGFIAYMRPTWTMQGHGEMLAPAVTVDVAVTAPVADAIADSAIPQVYVDVATTLSASAAEAEILLPIIRTGVAITAPVADAGLEMLPAHTDIITLIQAMPADLNAEILVHTARASVTTLADAASGSMDILNLHADTFYIAQARAADTTGELMPPIQIVAGTGYILGVTSATGCGIMLDYIVQIRYAGPRLIVLTRPEDIQITELSGKLDLINRKSRLEVFSK